MVQATEAVKLLLGIGETLIGRLLTYDALGMRFREVKLRRDAKCPLCGTNPTITDLSIHGQGAAACAMSSENGEPTTEGVLEPAGVGTRLAATGASLKSASDEGSGASAGASPGPRADRVTARTGC